MVDDEASRHDPAVGVEGREQRCPGDEVGQEEEGQADAEERQGAGVDAEEADAKRRCAVYETLQPAPDRCEQRGFGGIHARPRGLG